MSDVGFIRGGFDYMGAELRSHFYILVYLKTQNELSTAALQAVLAAYLGLLKSRPMEPHESDVITSGGSHARYA
jgi:hypothetical protein